MTDDWQQRVDAVWADDDLDDAARLERIDALAAELAPRRRRSSHSRWCRTETRGVRHPSPFSLWRPTRRATAVR